MRNGGHQHLRVGKKVALKAIFSAFKWLADNGSSSQTVGWLGDYPLLRASSPREAFLAHCFLCCHPDENRGHGSTFGQITHAVLLDDQDLVKRLAEKEQFTAFAYLDSTCCSPYSLGEALPVQVQAIQELFGEHRSANLLVVRSDNLHPSGYNSIRESITNLVVARFFISKGYLVLEDTGSGPDIIAVKAGVLQDLRERGFMGRGTSLSQLSTIRPLGKVHENYKEIISEDEIVAVESESVSPRKGLEQLIRGYKSRKFSYMAFFDRRILAAPFLNQGATSLDILTYDVSGLEYRKSENSQPAPDFWKPKKQAFVDDVKNSIKLMLLSNLTFEEISSLSPNRAQAIPKLLREIPKLQMERILDKVESVL